MFALRAAWTAFGFTMTIFCVWVTHDLQSQPKCNAQNQMHPTRLEPLVVMREWCSYASALVQCFSWDRMSALDLNQKNWITGKHTLFQHHESFAHQFWGCLVCVQNLRSGVVRETSCCNFYMACRNQSSVKRSRQSLLYGLVDWVEQFSWLKFDLSHFLDPPRRRLAHPCCNRLWVATLRILSPFDSNSLCRAVSPILNPIGFGAPPRLCWVQRPLACRPVYPESHRLWGATSLIWSPMAFRAPPGLSPIGLVALGAPPCPSWFQSPLGRHRTVLESIRVWGAPRPSSVESPLERHLVHLASSGFREPSRPSWVRKGSGAPPHPSRIQSSPGQRLAYLESNRLWGNFEVLIQRRRLKSTKG